MTRPRQVNVKSIVKNGTSLPIRPQYCHGKRVREAMVVFDLEQTHMVRGVTVAKPVVPRFIEEMISSPGLARGGKLEVKLSITPAP